MNTLHKSIASIIAIAMILFVAPGAFAAKVHKTFKNDSAVGANDFHVQATGAVPAPRIENASAKNVGTGNSAFPDSVFATPPEDFDWPTDSNLEEIPAGGKMKVCAVLSKAGSINGHFTRNGVEIDTKRVALQQSIVPNGVDTGLISLRNDGLEELLLTNIDVRVNNNADPNELGEFIPDGEPVEGLPAELLLAPGDEQLFPYGGASPNLAISISVLASSVDDPSDVFEELFADYPMMPTPTVSATWGQIKNIYK